MCFILNIYDTKIRVCGTKIWKKTRSRKNWIRTDDDLPRRNGYQETSLTAKYGSHRNVKLCRIIYKAHNPNYKINEKVIHIDGNKLNNNIDNLTHINQ